MNNGCLNGIFGLFLEKNAVATPQRMHYPRALSCAEQFFLPVRLYISYLNGSFSQKKV
jgi:hypothetical protein